MDLPAILRERLLAQPEAPLGPRTTLGVGGKAPWVLEPRRREELQLAVAQLHAAGLPFRLLGHGSNLLIGDEGVPEVVLHTRLMTGLWHEGEREHCLRAEAGVSLARLVSTCQRQGLGGAEMLIGIPGTLGGAVAGNAGSRHGWISERLVAVTVVRPDGSAEERPCRPEDFGYRRSPFRGAVILDAVLQFEPQDPAQIWERMAAILHKKRESQPLTARSAGCIFRNAPEAPSGQLIEAAGCKGWSVGGARVSAQHANFILNEGSASAGEVLQLIQRIRHEVAERTGQHLELEVEVWGDSAKGLQTALGSQFPTKAAGGPTAPLLGAQSPK
ncbi:MAG: UDP-N-acetylmuramate dehydrogenase [Planctomycetota bacterium]